jgi:hypothetical protein
MHDSLHIDDTGQAWRISQLLNSNRPRTAVAMSVDYLWSRWACERRWGDSLPSPARLTAEPHFLQEFSQRHSRPIAFEDTIEDHTARILGFVKTIETGANIQPVVIGPDGYFWDGMHRLAALYLLQRPTAEVLDFSDSVRNDETSCALQDVFEVSWLTGSHAQLLKKRFQQAEPYNHVYFANILRPEVADSIRGEYELLPWRLSETDFYEQYEIPLLDCVAASLGPWLKHLRRVLLSFEFSRALSKIVGGSSLRVGDIACHRTIAGQQIGIHTDYSDNAEICRLTLHFNPNWHSADGGLFVVFAGRGPDSAVATYSPKHNTAMLFRISPNSFHAVTPVESARERYSMVIAMVPN